MEQVILVDENDIATGVMEKIAAHEKGILHRAFSVFIFNSQGQMLVQQRSLNKYHSAGLWTNACCSHPRPGEDTHIAANRRLQEELGFDTPINKVFDFIYRSVFENGLTEHEFDHVFVGYYNNEITPDPAEVAAFRYIEMDEIEVLLQTQPEQFTAWFHIAFPKIMDWWRNHVA